MSMIDIPGEADIGCPAEAIFDLIVDFDGQDRWLTKSSAFRGTENISENPVKLGSTYREPGPLGVRNGEVVEYERPFAVVFHQPMTFKLGLGTVDVVMRYALTPGPASTHVRRVVTIAIPWPLKLLQPVIVGSFRAESARTLVALKAYADTLGDSTT
jgi:uncharacterized protein YndB with AHSA1/START domain